MRVQIDILNRQRKIKVSSFRVSRIVRKILKTLLKNGLLKDIKEAKVISLSVVLLGEKKMIEINYKYRGKNYLTDVLAFSFTEHVSKNDEVYLGEILISPLKAKLQAKEYEVTFYDELSRLLVHGILHLLGYDHERSNQEEKKMRKLEDKILKRLKS